MNKDIIHIKQPKLEIPTEENKIENEKHFNDRLRDAKVILTMFAAGQEVGTIARHFRIAESYVKNITEIGIEKFEQNLRKDYEVSEKNMTEIPTVEKPAKVTVVAPVVTSVAPTVQLSTTVIQPKTIKNSKCKLTEEKIIEMLKAKPEGMRMKELKVAVPDGINPGTWVVKISKLKIAGKITVIDRVAKAV